MLRLCRTADVFQVERLAIHDLLELSLLHPRHFLIRHVYQYIWTCEKQIDLLQCFAFGLP